MSISDPSPAPPPPAPADTPIVEIAPMRRRHLRQVLRVESRTSTTPWSLGLFLAELGRGDERAYLVALVDRRVVGFAGALLVAEEAHITTVAVDPDQQHRSIGQRLLLALIRRCTDLGAKAITLEVRSSNAPARALYRRFGFAPAGVRTGYYSRPVEDALVLWAHDVDRAPYLELLATVEAGMTPASRVLDEAPPGPLDEDPTTTDGLDPAGAADAAAPAAHDEGTHR
jgi:ribosomal-protein-alanine N-acetyltransferase